MDMYYAIYLKTDKGPNGAGYLIPGDEESHWVKFDFYCSTAPYVIFNANAILHKQDLYLEINAGILDGFSKEAFLVLLAYAKAVMHCDNIIVYFPKQCAHKERMKTTFSYFDFVELLSGDALILDNLIPESEYLYMVCTL